MMGTVISKCHCGSVELELMLPNGLENLRRCNCSICSRRNAVVASVAIDNLKVVKGSAELKEYTFNTHTAKHYFCSICGIYTHHQRRSVSHRRCCYGWCRQIRRCPGRPEQY